MGLASIWSRYKVLIIMGAGIGIVHWGWYNIQSNPLFNPTGEEPSNIKFLRGKFKDTKDN